MRNLHTQTKRSGHAEGRIAAVSAAAHSARCRVGESRHRTAAPRWMYRSEARCSTVRDANSSGANSDRPNGEAAVAPSASSSPVRCKRSAAPAVRSCAQQLRALRRKRTRLRIRTGPHLSALAAAAAAVERRRWQRKSGQRAPDARSRAAPRRAALTSMRVLCSHSLDKFHRHDGDGWAIGQQNRRLKKEEKQTKRKKKKQTESWMCTRLMATCDHCDCI